MKYFILQGAICILMKQKVIKDMVVIHVIKDLVDMNLYANIWSLYMIYERWLLLF